MVEKIGIQQQEALGYLCHLIIDELKNISANRNGLSPFSLHEALSCRSEVIDLLGTQGCFSELKSAYLRILTELNHQPGNGYKERFPEILARIHAAASFDALKLLQKDIVDLVQNYNFAVLEDKRALSTLLVEIGAHLVEVESKCLNMIEDTTVTHRANDVFNDMMDSKMSDLEKSAQSSQSLLEIREIVQAKLETIKTALEKKRTEDRVREHRFESAMGKLRDDLKDMQERVVRDQLRRKTLEQEVLIDPLTGIANRRGLDRYLRREMKNYKRCKTPFSLLFFDIDEFKRVNDTYGHWVGDKCITNIVDRVKQNLRTSDFMARYGGDEFIVCLPGTDRKSAHMVAKKLSSAICNTRFIYQDTEILLTVSIGLTQVEEEDRGTESIFTRADSALYEAKNQGRDLVVVV